MSMRMSMPEYLDEIRHAIGSLLPILWDERTQLEELEQRVAELDEYVTLEYERARMIELNAEEPDDIAIATMREWENYWGPDKERHYVSADRDLLRNRIEARKFSAEALAANVLQHAKQGLALVHGGPPSPPIGRTVGQSQKLSEVVWCARNQALHWEEQSFRPPVRTCFKVLADEVDSKFTEYATRNMALDVLKSVS